MTTGVPISTNQAAESADAQLPAFLSQPAGAPIYHGFVVVPETYTDGWCMGVITDYEDPDGVDSGDAFVIAPDGSRAGVVWEVGVEPVQEILPSDQEHWGVYAVCFPHVVRNAADLASAFRAILPSLKEAHARVKPHVG
jgi:hypothetical protein